MGRVSNGPAFYIEKSHILKFHNSAECDDCCLEPGKFKVLKMLDLQTKSAIISNNLQV